jgi:hypothetical protein
MRWMLEVTGFAVEELSLSEGPQGEFRTLNGYFLARPTAIVPELGDHQLMPEPSTRPPVRFDPGHYYSPMYDARDFTSRQDRIWPPNPRATRISTGATKHR